MPNCWQALVTVLYTVRLVAGSVLESVPLMVTGVPKTGDRLRSSTALPAAPVTVTPGVMVAPKAEQLLVIVIAAAFTLKKMLPRAFTIIRPVVVGRFGMTMFSVPSLAVFLASVSVKVTPPSVDKIISTLEQLMGAALVLATFQLMVAVLLPLAVQLEVVDCEVTVNAPPLAIVLTVTFSLAVQPPPLAASRTSTIKFSARSIVGNTS